jgi:hypothetical protein
MEIEVRLSLPDLKRALRRLIVRLPDECEAGSDFIVFSAVGHQLSITAGGTSEALSASVVYGGRAIVPYPVFRGIARTLRFYSGKTVTVASSEGLLRIARTEFRHRNISVSLKS